MDQKGVGDDRIPEGTTGFDKHQVVLDGQFKLLVFFELFGQGGGDQHDFLFKIQLNALAFEEVEAKLSVCIGAGELIFPNLNAAQQQSTNAQGVVGTVPCGILCATPAFYTIGGSIETQAFEFFSGIFCQGNITGGGVKHQVERIRIVQDCGHGDVVVGSQLEGNAEGLGLAGGDGCQGKQSGEEV